MKFAKLFEYGENQLLVKKTFGDDQEPEIECTTVVQGLKITNTLGFSNKDKRDSGFDSMTKENCLPMLYTMQGFFKGSITVEE